MTILYLMAASTKPLADKLMALSPLPGRFTDPEGFASVSLADVTGLVIATQLYKPEVVARLKAEAKALRWIQALSTGVDYFFEYGLPDGVVLTSASGAHAPNVADHALSLVLSLCRGSAVFAQAQAASQWTAWNDLPEQRSLTGMKAVVLGNGPSGVASAKRLLGFDCHVTLVGRREKEAVPGAVFGNIADLDAILPQAELLVMVLPSTPQTVGILSAKRLALLPKGALIVNVGRGDAVDEAALTELLASGHLGGAGLDVMQTEPLPQDSPLWQTKGAVLTPHVAGRSDASVDFLVEVIGKNLRRFASGEALLNVMAQG